jgi:hypothetical protein
MHVLLIVNMLLENDLPWKCTYDFPNFAPISSSENEKDISVLWAGNENSPALCCRRRLFDSGFVAACF